MIKHFSLGYKSLVCRRKLISYKKTPRLLNFLFNFWGVVQT